MVESLGGEHMTNNNNDRYQSWIIWYALALHLWWGLLLCVSSEQLLFTGVWTLYELLPQWAAGAWLLLVAVLAFSALTTKASISGLFRILPQQMTLVVSAGDAIVATYHSQYADGVTRPSAFILADQIPAVLIAVFHTCAVVDVYATAAAERGAKK